MSDKKPGATGHPRVPVDKNLRPSTAPSDQRNYTPRPSEEGNVRPTTDQSSNSTPPMPSKK